LRGAADAEKRRVYDAIGHARYLEEVRMNEAVLFSEVNLKPSKIGGK
jgi:hypothetical protein